MCQVELQDSVNGCRGVHVEDVSEGTGEISGRTLLFATFTLSGFANLCSIISCFGPLVLLENHVKTREKCMYF